METHELRSMARVKLQTRSLPCDPPARMWGGPGSGQLCALCETKIPHDEVELEAEMDDRKSLHFHRRCFAVWELARVDDC